MLIMYVYDALKANGFCFLRLIYFSFCYFVMFCFCLIKTRTVHQAVSVSISRQLLFHIKRKKEGKANV